MLQFIEVVYAVILKTQRRTLIISIPKYIASWDFTHMCMSYRLTHTNIGSLDTLHEFSTTVKAGIEGWRRGK